MSSAADHGAALRELLTDVHAVLLDFDGPVTDLFRGRSTAPVAREIKAAVRVVWGYVDPEVDACDDSHGILRLLREMYDRSAPERLDPQGLVEAEKIVTGYEYEAVKTAMPAPHLVRLVDVLSKHGPPLVIVSNNSDGPIWEFFKGERVQRQEKVYAVAGRDPLLRDMKPHPGSVERALKYVGLPPEAALLIGDQLTDLSAAQQAGTPFLGYTQSPERAAQMLDLGAKYVVSSHKPLIEAVEGRSSPN
ncbi:HAD family hydrolase [Streptomyces sp. GbtcB6]|uniref:HAD family hydrolase n=1 Tax=Streptomyces sp. GbtcB6 TaxID=2824751 RepID=UPI001C2F97E6|nr:HAD family hydrolase [Streptomyces sp. GbtcB6]